MTLEILKIRKELRDLVDAYAYLGDDKKISEQTNLFTADTIYKVYMGDFLAANVSGRKNIETEFSGHASHVKTYFTLNGQHTVEIDADTDTAAATGVSYSQIKMVREIEGKDILSDYSVRYDDKYVNQNGKWLIKERVGYFILVEVRQLNN